MSKEDAERTYQHSGNVRQHSWAGAPDLFDLRVDRSTKQWAAGRVRGRVTSGAKGYVVRTAWLYDVAIWAPMGLI